MKYIYAATMLASLIGIASCWLLGVGYYSEAQNYSGLHPALASLLSAIFAIAGYAAADRLTSIEE